MKKTRRSLLFLLAVSITLIPIVRVQSVKAGNPQFCNQYARKAVQQFSEIKDNISGINYTEAAWSGDYKYHYDWCLAVSESAANNSTRYRENQLNLSRALDGYSELLLPGMVIGLRHKLTKKPIAATGYSRSGNNEAMYDPTVLDNPVLTYLHGGDLKADVDVGFSWNSIRDRCPAGFDFSFLPPGIVLGLWHNQNQRRGEVTVDCKIAETGEQAPKGLKVRHGGDQGASAGGGYTWFETTGERFSGDWGIVNLLPKYTVIGLTHTMRKPKQKLLWQNEVYDPTCARCPSPPDFVHVHGGDLGAPSGQGFSWYEKVTGEEPQNLGGRIRQAF